VDVFAVGVSSLYPNSMVPSDSERRDVACPPLKPQSFNEASLMGGEACAGDSPRR
jgi:hypothetical protein